MSSSIVEQLADFTARSDFSSLPPEVGDEGKRLLLDSLGCAIEAVDDRGANIGIDYAKAFGGGRDQATIIGSAERVSEVAAAFANAELVNAFDHDTVVPPGHVTPYVLPGALAAAEAKGASGKDLISAIAVAHEISYRLGKAMDYLRDIKDGVVTPPEVSGYSVTIFGAAAAIGQVKGFSSEVLANALGIAGSISPVNAHRTWMMHAPSTTIKYLLPGALAQSAMTAAYLAEGGHRGDRMILDDAEFGYPKIIGTKRWEAGPITEGLGDEWRFYKELSYKPYPHCRIMHALFDALIEVVEKHDLRPDDIESIAAYGESFVLQPTWVNRDVSDPRDAQFSMVHGLSVAAHRIPPGRDWQDPKTVFDPSVLGLMDRITFSPHPDYDTAIGNNPAARLSRVDVVAHGETFTNERHYPKGSPSPDASTFMTTDEIEAKFRHNAEALLSQQETDQVVDAVLNLESLDDVGALMSVIRSAAANR